MGAVSGRALTWDQFLEEEEAIQQYKNIIYNARVAGLFSNARVAGLFSKVTYSTPN